MRTRRTYQEFIADIFDELRNTEGDFNAFFCLPDDNDGDNNINNNIYQKCSFICNPDNRMLIAVVHDDTKLYVHTLRHLYDIGREYKTVSAEQYDEQALRRLSYWNKHATAVPIVWKDISSINREAAIEILRATLSRARNLNRRHIYKIENTEEPLRVALAFYIAVVQKGSRPFLREIARVYLGYRYNAELTENEKEKLQDVIHNRVRNGLKRLTKNCYCLHGIRYYKWFYLRRMQQDGNVKLERTTVTVLSDIIFDKPYTVIDLDEIIRQMEEADEKTKEHLDKLRL